MRWTQWYATPDKLHSWFPQTTDSCWRCKKVTRTVLYIWRHGPLISKEITGTDIELDSALRLLNTSTQPIRRYKNSLVRHLLNAAKILIPRAWKSTCTPSTRLTRDWLSEMNSFHAMEEMVFSYDWLDYYHEVWNTWVTFRYSDNYNLIVGT